MFGAVSSFFTLIAQKLGAGFTGAKNVLGTGFLKAKDVFVALSKRNETLWRTPQLQYPLL